MRKSVKASKLSVSLPFGLGELELVPDEAQQQAAWELYVELSTRVSSQPLEPWGGSLREALNSLHEIFSATRETLRRAGPCVSQGPSSFGAIAITVLNKGIRPFLTKWHSELSVYEHKMPINMNTFDYEQKWDKAPEFRQDLKELQTQINVYIQVLASIAGVN